MPNARPWIIFLEGLPGSGKSTTASHISNEFKADSPHDLFLENSPDNPIGKPWRAEDAREIIKTTTGDTYWFHDWEEIRARGSSFLFESRLLQNTSLFEMLNGTEDSELGRIPRKIVQNLTRTHRLMLMLLHVSDARSHLQQTITERDVSHPEWSKFVFDLFTGQPWSVERGYSGKTAFVEAMSEWNTRQPAIAQSLGIPLTVIQDPMADRTAATEVAVTTAASFIFDEM